MAARQSAAVKRILLEVKEMRREESQQDMYRASPLEDDLFEWHFTVRGPPDSPFEGGLYHGRILLPPEYPLKAPEIILLTPSGRFETGKRICLSFTSFHQETWQPSWGVRTMLTALLSFMPSKAEGIGSLDYTDEERRRLAVRSLSYTCPTCGVKLSDVLPPQSHTSTPCAPPEILSVSECSEISPRGDSIAAPVNDALRVQQTSGDMRADTAQEDDTKDHSTVDKAKNDEQVSQTPRKASRAEAPRPSRAGETTAAAAAEGGDLELKIIAFTIIALIVAIVARRVIKQYFSGSP
mmetsp:Transcript_16620/g.36133  ORF Transcript_16620/g.36133 Transcript_16620/m.36133 type:complete len:295 (-) Transcript_16620:507-1391(-)